MNLLRREGPNILNLRKYAIRAFLLLREQIQNIEFCHTRRSATPSMCLVDQRDEFRETEKLYSGARHIRSLAIVGAGIINSENRWFLDEEVSECHWSLLDIIVLILFKSKMLGFCEQQYTYKEIMLKNRKVNLQ